MAVIMVMFVIACVYVSTIHFVFATTTAKYFRGDISSVITPFQTTLAVHYTCCGKTIFYKASKINYNMMLALL
jgi:hypothetical protein